ncbi:MAG: phospholipid carrier-dependent glycosyltransferase [Lysobacteraceae bacterium]
MSDEPRRNLIAPCLAGTLALVLLAALAVLRSSIGTALDSFTIDEPWHIVAGTAYVRDGARHLNPEHPPLVKLVVGAAMPSDFILPSEPALQEKAQEREWVESTMFQTNDAARAQAHARHAMWLFNGMLIAALGLLLWRAAGFAWAAGTLGFIALEPTLGAHLPVAMTDGPLALTLAPAIVAAGMMAAAWRWPWVIATGVFAGLALSTKHSALAGLLGVVIVLSAGIWAGLLKGGMKEGAARQGKLIVAVALALALLWAHYGFRFHADADGSDRFNLPMETKIEEVSTPALQAMIQFADTAHLLPRPYLWGLADTVRAGVEGRGIATHLIWGEKYHGRTPWFTWPAILAAKIPLALLALSALGVALLLWRSGLNPATRWMLAALAFASIGHLAALIVSPAAWGGVRHATPLILTAAILGGGAVSQAWRRRSRLLLGAVSVLFVAAFAMTIREPRLWEYHNELVGGTKGGYVAFHNEGVDLGQRYGEIRAFHDAQITRSGEPMYVNYQMIERQMRAERLNYRRKVESLDDTNTAGVWDGWHVYTATDELPWPEGDWDPKDVFAQMQRVAQLGYVSVWRGRLVRPQSRASSLGFKVADYIYKENGSDWALVAQRLEEVVALIPQSVGSAVELGNAYLRLGDGANATRVYRGLLEQTKAPLDAKVERQLREQIGRIEQAGQTAADISRIEPMRNPWME